MKKREMVDFETGERQQVKAYVWRGHQAWSATGHCVGPMVATDLQGRYWAGLRIGASRVGHKEDSRFDFGKRCESKEAAICVAEKAARYMFREMAQDVMYGEAKQVKPPAEKYGAKQCRQPKKQEHSLKQ
jgi:hypothetical protein